MHCVFGILKALKHQMTIFNEVLSFQRQFHEMIRCLPFVGFSQRLFKEPVLSNFKTKDEMFKNNCSSTRILQSIIAKIIIHSTTLCFSVDSPCISVCHEDLGSW